MRARSLALAPLYSILYLLFIFRRKTAGPSRNELIKRRLYTGGARPPRAMCCARSVRTDWLT